MRLLQAFFFALLLFYFFSRALKFPLDRFLRPILFFLPFPKLSIRALKFYQALHPYFVPNRPLAVLGWRLSMPVPLYIRAIFYCLWRVLRAKLAKDNKK